MSEDESYRVAIKPSAWKASAAIGEWVNRNGPRRAFGSKALAREWARNAAGPDARVWIQDAVPWDGGDADGYLVGGSRKSQEGRPADGSQSTLADDPVTRPE